MVTVIKQCKIQLLIWQKALLFPKNQVICLKNWKLWLAPTTIEFNNFWWIFHTFPGYYCLQKRVPDFLNFVFRSWVIDETGFCEWVETRSFLTLANNSRSKNKIKKNPELTFVDIDKKETCAKFQQKLSTSILVGARQRFQFFKQNVWFFKNRALSKFCMRFCIT